MRALEVGLSSEKTRCNQATGLRGGCRDQEDAEIAAPGYRYNPEKGERGHMKRKYIPVEEAFKEWRKDREYAAAYDALEEEIARRPRLSRHAGTRT